MRALVMVFCLIGTASAQEITAQEVYRTCISGDPALCDKTVRIAYNRFLNFDDKVPDTCINRMRTVDDTELTAAFMGAFLARQEHHEAGLSYYMGETAAVLAYRRQCPV